jgi:hypothetical protein
MRCLSCVAPHDALSVGLSLIKGALHAVPFTAEMDEESYSVKRRDGKRNTTAAPLWNSVSRDSVASRHSTVARPRRQFAVVHSFAHGGRFAS